MTSPEPSDPSSLIAGLVTVVRENHLDMANLVRGVPVLGLKWMPIEETPHLSGHVLHVLEVEDYLAAVAAGEDIPWTLPLGSSLALVMPADELVRRIAATDARLVRSLEGITPGRLAQPQPGDERTIGMMLVEDLAHSSLHLGHMQLTRHLMTATLKSLEVPPYEHWA